MTVSRKQSLIPDIESFILPQGQIDLEINKT